MAKEQNQLQFAERRSVNMTNVEKLKNSGHYRGVVEYVKENTCAVDIDKFINEAMSEKECIDAWLVWNGIMGYTDDIIRLVRGMGEY